MSGYIVRGPASYLEVERETDCLQACNGKDDCVAVSYLQGHGECWLEDYYEWYHLEIHHRYHVYMKRK